MCLEGIQLYVMLVEVFEAEKSRIKWYYLAAYGTFIYSAVSTLPAYYCGTRCVSVVMDYELAILSVETTCKLIYSFQMTRHGI
jgi:7 transmembrane receptor (Secretin family)